MKDWTSALRVPGLNFSSSSFQASDLWAKYLTSVRSQFLTFQIKAKNSPHFVGLLRRLNELNHYWHLVCAQLMLVMMNASVFLEDLKQLDKT